jgi:hypothetical protein
LTGGRTKRDRFPRIDADLLLIKWMAGFIVAGVSRLVPKAFFA